MGTWGQGDINPVLMKTKCGGEMRGARSQSVKLFTYKQWLPRGEMTVTTSWWCRFVSPANSTVVLQFYLPENFPIHVLKMHLGLPSWRSG